MLLVVLLLLICIGLMFLGYYYFQVKRKLVIPLSYTFLIVFILIVLTEIVDYFAYSYGVFVEVAGALIGSFVAGITEFEKK